ncbi:hypothetical protein G5I_11613 [Acromyrmex echinatior]|uniref:Uncharacterized protein n=1 Tax=Acromyrmex echinatior TaxID=103372 RepID=F4X031_ACREC|nr:hypothetical protein G5I_11613 [Acromyrmex echinatior]
MTSREVSNPNKDSTNETSLVALYGGWVFYPYVCDLFTSCCRRLYQHAGPSDPLVICHFYVRMIRTREYNAFVSGLQIVAYTPYYFHSGKESTPGEFDYPRVDVGGDDDDDGERETLSRMPVFRGVLVLVRGIA